MSNQAIAVQKRALLIGCPTGSLTGVENDLDRMETILGRYGFATTKAQIITAWGDIVEKTSQGDALVIYYSGHGGMAERQADANSKRGRQRLLYLVPMDFENSKEDDWRGISDIELSKLLHKATDKTDNVTLILDCCHSARMARAPGIVKSIDPHDYREILEHITKMMAEGQFGDVDFHIERNPKPICVVAAAETDSAYERSFPVSTKIIRMSVLVEALDKALPGENEQNPRASWRSIMLRIKDRLRINCPSQSPQIEGDDLRFAFSLDKADPHGAIPISLDNGKLVLHGGHLHGLKKDDVYVVVPFDDERLDPNRQIAEVIVDRVGPTESHGSFTGNPPPPFDDGVKAFPKGNSLAEMAVELRCSDEFADQIRSSLKDSKFLRVPDTDDDLILATIEVNSSKLSVHSHEGYGGEEEKATVLLAEWQLGEGESMNVLIDKSVAILESLARSRHLLSLQEITKEITQENTQENTPKKSLSRKVDIEMGIVIDGQPLPYSPGTVTVQEGENLYVKIRNTGDSKLWVSIFDICAESVILLSDGSPTGYEISQGEVYTFGDEDFCDGGLIGTEMKWPEWVPKARQIRETFVIVVTDGPIDLRGLTTSSNTPRGTNDISALIELMDGLGSGGGRPAAPESQRRGQFRRYGIHRLFLQLQAKAFSV
ncbi:unnamed protein product [Clonostachys byssicola]|uniref:Peptidase C14 caspase domain-containing protein n=1 Tax=Clonostachys byssicola TaxID=160290 RepID=A0A9N9YCJ8_9HYPO|nr:unnamed protein product [Clonostachys byssicola]